MASGEQSVNDVGCNTCCRILREAYQVTLGEQSVNDVGCNTYCRILREAYQVASDEQSVNDVGCNTCCRVDRIYKSGSQIAGLEWNSCYSESGWCFYLESEYYLDSK